MFYRSSHSCCMGQMIHGVSSNTIQWYHGFQRGHVLQERTPHSPPKVPTRVLASGRMWTRERNVNTGLNSQKSPLKSHPVLLKLKSADAPPSATASSSPFFQQANYLAMEWKRTLEIHGFWCSFPAPPPSKDLFVLNRCSWFALSYTHVGSFILFYWLLLFFNLFKTPGENKHISDIPL